MRRPGKSVRMVLVATVALVPGAALAQTTTSSTSTTTSTVATTTTSTTVVHPCTGQPCTQGPPQVEVSSPSGRIQADLDGSCWLSLSQNVSACLAVARMLGYQPPSLVVTEGDTVTIRFLEPVPGSPRRVSLIQSGQATPLTAANPTTFRVTNAPGIHNFGLSAEWLQGEVRHGFGLDVRRAATPADPSKGRRIALTG
jgi:hypothetical protein